VRPTVGPHRREPRDRRRRHPSAHVVLVHHDD
jgi:hypothetical protein